MSVENVEIVRRVYDAWARGDFSPVEDFDADIEFEMVDWPHQTKVTGIDAMWETWRSTLSAWVDFRSIPDEIADFGDRVLVTNRIVGRGKESGADVSADVATVFTLEGGRVMRMALYWDRDSARSEAEGRDTG
jgi:ketosteroid isomerase-like protein